MAIAPQGSQPSKAANWLASEAIALASDTVNRLNQLSSAANKARTCLHNDLSQIRAQLTKSHEEITRRQSQEALSLERAAKALAVRNIEVDNKSLQVTQNQLQLTEDQRRLQLHREKIMQQITTREESIAAREASLQYAVLDQKRLHKWSRALRDREARIKESETAQKAYENQAQTGLKKREDNLKAREEAFEKRQRQQEEEMQLRKASVDSMEEDIKSRRAEMLLQIESEKCAFWSHQQKLSADIARQVNQLARLQADVRREFQHGEGLARQSLKHVRDNVAQIESQVARTCHDSQEDEYMVGHEDDEGVPEEVTHNKLTDLRNERKF